MSFTNNLKSRFYLLFLVLLFLVSISFWLRQVLFVRSVQERVREQSVPYQPYQPNSHSIAIDYHDKEVAEKTDTLLRSLMRPQNELSRSTIKEIRVDGRDYYGNWTLVEAFFHSLHNVEDVHWYNDQPIPPGILQSLESLNPTAKLYYYTWFDWGNYITEQEIEDAKRKVKTRQSIVNSTNMYSFTGHINYGWKNNRQSDLDLVWQILTTCPNIKELDLTIGWSGCEVGAGQPYAFDFSSIHSARLPPLEVLKLNGYDFESTSNREWVRVPEYDNKFQESETDEWDGLFEQMEVVRIEQESRKSDKMNIEEWLGAMDWSQIHTLHLGYVSPKALKLLSGPVLPSLKHLSLRGLYGDQSIETALAHEKFLNSTLLPLDSITLQNIGPRNPATLVNIITMKHGTALKHLKLTGTSSNPTSPQIFRLHSSAPNLETLDINMNRPTHSNDATHDDPQWDLPLLSSLAVHPSLRHLTLRFSSPEHEFEELYSHDTYPRRKDFYGYAGRTDGIEDTLVNHTSVAELWRILRARDVDPGSTGEQVGSGGMIETLEVIVGDWELRDHVDLGGGPAGVVARYKCWVGADGEGECEGEATQNAYYG